MIHWQGTRQDPTPITNKALAERVISKACPQRQRAVTDLAKELGRKRCADHPAYKASLPPDLGTSHLANSHCDQCWVVWRARGNPPPP